MRGLKFQNKVGAAFGSYGWSGEAPKMVQAALAEMKYQLPATEVRYQWVPTEADLEPVRALARSVAAALPKEPAPADFNL